MKLFVGALVVCAIIGTVSADMRTAEGHFNDIRKRLGHFKDESIFLDLYKIYATAFVLPEHKERSNDDYRNYLPSGDECMAFFRKFRIDDYQLRDLDEVVVLDACLGYLYESGHHDEDLAVSATLKDHLQEYIDDQQLSALYQGTKIDEVSVDSKRCVANLLVSSIQAKKQFGKKVVCNHHWLNLFNKFAACQDEMFPEKENDTYLRIIYELVRTRGNECFNNEINSLNQAVRTEYINNPFSIGVNKVLYWNTARQQQGKRYYPTKLAIILRAVQGTDQQINIREVADIVRGIALKDPNFIARFLKNMAKYANERIKPNSRHLLKSSKGADDPTGVNRYDNLVDGMCNFFRKSDSENFYDFVTPFTRMVTMLKYPDVFGVTKDEFIEKVLAHSFETGALYLAVSSCNILTFTEGQFIRQPQNKELQYKVVFKPNLNGMVQWPDVGYY